MERSEGGAKKRSEHAEKLDSEGGFANKETCHIYLNRLINFNILLIGRLAPERDPSNLVLDRVGDLFE